MKQRNGPDGIHLFDRYTGLNVLLDEIILPQGLWSLAPRQVSIALTNLCDLQCAYCYAPKYRAKLDTDAVCSWLSELDAAGCLGVGFGGGEPTLHSDFLAICGYAAKHTQLAVTFTTHGHRLDDQFLRHLAGKVHFVRFSIDGVGATYESQRGRRYQDLLVRIDATRQIAPIGFNVVVNQKTISDLDSIEKLASTFGVSELLLLKQQATRSVPGIDSETSEALLSWVHQYRGPVPLRVSERDADGMPTCIPLPLERSVNAYAHIDAAGYVKHTSFDDSGIPIGDAGVLQALHQLQLDERGVK